MVRTKADNLKKNIIDIGVYSDKSDVSGVKSKIDTTLKKKEKKPEEEKVNEELNKKYEQVQKDNAEKLGGYRDMILKMKQEKRSKKQNEKDPKKKAKK